jgi:hypothetical protein
MAILTGVLMFIGKLSGIKHYRNLHDPKTYASEIGSVPKDVYKTSSIFENNRLSNDEFTGCTVAVKSIRRGLRLLIPEMVDTGFTARLMKFTRELSLKDLESVKGVRSLRFSAYRPSMKDLYFNKKFKAMDSAIFALRSSHSDTRVETVLTVKGLRMLPRKSPGGATHYRILSHVCIVSDYLFSGEKKRYEPSNPLDGLSAYAYSGITDIGVELTNQIVVPFPEGTVLGEDCTVIHCVAIEFMEPNGVKGYRTIYGASVEIMDVF